MPTTLVAARPSILVAGEEGLFEIDAGEAVRKLAEGPVTYAVDDTRGGVLYQVDRGRDWEAFFHNPVPGRSTVVWWIPVGAATPQQLLVPTPGAGHDITLHDAFRTEESFSVVYQRHEGTEPPFDGDMQDTLRVFDVATQQATELYRVRGWEWSLTEVSAANGLVAATEETLYGAGCRLFEMSGTFAHRPGVPTATARCFDGTETCPTGCSLSGDGDRVVCRQLASSPDGDGDTLIFVNDVESGERLHSYKIDPELGPFDLDVFENLVLLNRTGLFSSDDADRPALIIDLADDDPRPDELPVAGAARFVTAHT